MLLDSDKNGRLGPQRLTLLLQYLLGALVQLGGGGPWITWCEFGPDICVFDTMHDLVHKENKKNKEKATEQKKKRKRMPLAGKKEKTNKNSPKWRKRSMKDTDMLK